MLMFMVWLVFISLEQKINLSHTKSCKNKDFCGNIMPSEKRTILEFEKHMKSDKMSYIIYADIKPLLKK